MVERMESRWKEWEQPLLILSFALHPSHKLQKFRSSTPNLTWTHIGQWLKYYYESWFGSKPVSILHELTKYKRAEDPYDMDSFNQFRGNLVDFWDSTIGIGPELARVAIRIHGISVNSASVERLWSSMGYLHTNRRNRLEQKKVLAMSQIRSEILFTRKIKDVRECEREMQRLHIATPICPDNENEDDNLNEGGYIQVSDDEDKVDNNETTNNNDDREELIIQNEEQRWNQLIKEWIELGNRENQFENNEDECFLSPEWNNDFDFAGRNVHPADDERAKWSLSTLFESSLESPSFLGSDEIFTNAY
ncbi:unnamed protein product [Rhizophagus irregularis]|nr:unnamed protein product [Rhizophagus irregularis]